MKMDQLLGFRFKETPSDAQIESHILMLRGGYIKNVGSGIFSLYPPAKRIIQKIERIVREEMDAIDGQEIFLPVSMPASLWKESGRYDSVGSELLRFQDRWGSDMVLGMTHEEAVVHLCRDAAQSYQNYPFMVYQIQTKFRDETRPRAGLIRVREFTMKDAYSFHATQEDLEAYYARAHKAYENVFVRCGLPETISVQSDSGMMGGKIAHEFMLITPAGEDYLAICEACDFRSNMEIAPCIVENKAEEAASLEKIHTPGTKTIEALCEFLGITEKQTCKAVLYQKNATVAESAGHDYVVIFIRGDLEVNEIKLRNLLGEEVHPAVDASDAFTCGFIGPVGLQLPKGAVVLYDKSLAGTSNLVTGACEDDYHVKGFTIARDVENVSFCDIAKILDGGICPTCGKPAIALKRGVEVGNIFQLGTKYSESMNMTFLDQNGKTQHPIMGCYGIGVTRTMAAVCEASHDDYGPIWPMAIAPWQVHICAIRGDDPEVKAAANGLYESLQAQGVEVLFDDRKVSAGFMFSDADLMGVPVRVIVSPKTIARGVLELKTRDKSVARDIAIDTAAEEVKALVRELQGA